MKKKIIEISLFVTEICPKNHQILGDFSFFPYNKLTGIETDNVPRLCARITGVRVDFLGPLGCPAMEKNNKSYKYYG